MIRSDEEKRKYAQRVYCPLGYIGVKRSHVCLSFICMCDRDKFWLLHHSPHTQMAIYSYVDYLCMELIFILGFLTVYMCEFLQPIFETKSNTPTLCVYHTHYYLLLIFIVQCSTCKIGTDFRIEFTPYTMEIRSALLFYNCSQQLTRK